MVAPLLIAGQVLIQNAAVVLFPGWIPTGGARARGRRGDGPEHADVRGHAARAGASACCRPRSLSGGLGYLVYQVAGWVALLPAAIVMAVILAGEAYLVIGWLGRVLERTDPAQVEVAE